MNCFSAAIHRITAHEPAGQTGPADNGQATEVPAQAAAEPEAGQPADGQAVPPGAPLTGQAAPDTLQGQTFNWVARAALEMLHQGREELIWAIRLLALGGTAASAVMLVHALAGPSGPSGHPPAPPTPVNGTSAAGAPVASEALAIAAMAAALQVLGLL